MRRMLTVLRMDSASDRLVPQPGLDDVTVLVEGMSSAGMRPELVVEGNPVPLAPGIELSAYRIVQEALTNALKHGARGQVTVTLRYLSGSLEIEVVDPGAVASSRSSSGFGLAGMIERVAVYGGSLTSGARSHGGYAVTVRLPTGAGVA
jgi:signal transduction histidine kinase